MSVVDSLLLDAKQAILEEHHRRFQTFYKEGRVEEAMQQFNTTIACATDLLNDSLRVLEQAIERHGPKSDPPASA